MKSKHIKLALICTAGGHFEQLNNLDDLYNTYDHFWITNRLKQTESALEREKKYYIDSVHFKKPWQYFFQLIKTVYIFINEKPTHILSTGSGTTGFIPFLVAKLFGIPFIYIETYSRVNNLTNLANFILKSGFPVLTQWKIEDRNNVTYIGPIFKKIPINKTVLKKKHIFVTLGTRGEQFCRFIQAIEQLIKEEIITDRVIVQAGNTKYDSKLMDIFDFCSVDKIEKFMQEAIYVLTQESAGIVNKCLKYDKRFIVMPRDYNYGELPAKGDMREDLQYRLEELGYTKVVKNVDELKFAIKNINKLKTGWKFDNSSAISILKNMVEK